MQAAFFSGQNHPVRVVPFPENREQSIINDNKHAFTQKLVGISDCSTHLEKPASNDHAGFEIEVHDISECH